MENLTLQVGQGENKTITFKITTTVFTNTDKLLFAVKPDCAGRKHVLSVEEVVANLDLEQGVYTFVVNLTSDQTRSLAIRSYFYDLTLIDQYGQAKPLMDPQEFIVNGTIGASVKREVSND